MAAQLIVALIILGAIYAICIYVLPEPARKVGIAAVAVLAILVLLNFTLAALGAAPIVNLHLN